MRTNDFPNVTTNRDEYPFYATVEGGSGASLKRIPYDDDQKEGRVMNQFRDACQFKSGPDNGYLVAPTAALTPTAGSCGE
jgi:hypothetical protein